MSLQVRPCGQRAEMKYIMTKPIEWKDHETKSFDGSPQDSEADTLDVMNQDKRALVKFR